jgi:hypothetical protein
MVMRGVPSQKLRNCGVSNLAVCDNLSPAPRIRAACRAMTATGHEERFPPPRLSDRYGFSKETVARVPGTDRDAPIPAVRAATIEPLESTLKSHSRPLRRIVGVGEERSFAPGCWKRQWPAHVNSSSSAFASFRSAVSNLSVNQP